MVHAHLNGTHVGGKLEYIEFLPVFFSFRVCVCVCVLLFDVTSLRVRCTFSSYISCTRVRMAYGRCIKVTYSSFGAFTALQNCPVFWVFVFISFFRCIFSPFSLAFLLIRLLHIFVRIGLFSSIHPHVPSSPHSLSPLLLYLSIRLLILFHFCLLLLFFSFRLGLISFSADRSVWYSMA